MNGPQKNRDSGQYGGASQFPFAEWLNALITSIMKMIGASGPGTSSSAPPKPSLGDTLRGAGVQVPATPRRTIVGYINTGIYKYERARRSAAVAKQYEMTLRTIRLTHRAIRRAPRSNRYLFQGYTSVLRDAKRRVKQLNTDIRHIDAHLRQYNPPAIQEELKRLEKDLLAATSPASRAEIELRIEARTDLLETVQSFDERLETMAAQLGSIAATIELNHVRIVTLGGAVTSSVSDELLNIRMQEVTEQLKLLEESLRELQ